MSTSQTLSLLFFVFLSVVDSSFLYSWILACSLQSYRIHSSNNFSSFNSIKKGGKNPPIFSIFDIKVIIHQLVNSNLYFVFDVLIFELVSASEFVIVFWLFLSAKIKKSVRKWSYINIGFPNGPSFFLPRPGLKKSPKISQYNIWNRMLFNLFLEVSQI